MRFYLTAQFIITLLLVVGGTAYAQRHTGQNSDDNKSVTINEQGPVERLLSDSVYTAAEVMPEPVNGMAELAKKVEYPAKAKRKKIQGQVLVAAIIDERGLVMTAECISKKLGGGCDEAALKAVTATQFSPAMNGGVPVKAKIILPFTFKLDSNKKSKK